MIRIEKLGRDLLLGWNLVSLCLLLVDCWLGISRLSKKVGISISFLGMKLMVVLLSGSSILRELPEGAMRFDFEDIIRYVDAISTTQFNHINTNSFAKSCVLTFFLFSYLLFQLPQSAR